MEISNSVSVSSGYDAAVKQIKAKSDEQEGGSSDIKAKAAAGNDQAVLELNRQKAAQADPPSPNDDGTGRILNTRA